MDHMDVLEPPVVWVNGRCYRTYETNALANHNVPSYVEDDYGPLFEDEETHEENIKIEPVSDTKFKHSFHVAKAYFPHIVGSKSSSLRRLETETKTTIHIPKSTEDADIVIIGPNRKAITSARHRIDLIKASCRSKMKPTHFLSIPFNQEDIMAMFDVFKNDVLNTCGRIRGISKEIFQAPQRLHLTIGVLLLLDDEERNAAIEILQRCKEELIEPVIQHYKHIKIQLRGIECMNDDPSEVNVLYAKVENDGPLQKLVNDISTYFLNAGLMKKDRTEENNVKLHVTLMNTTFKRSGEHQKTWKEKVDTFDAKRILQDYKDVVFGETYLKEIHLSRFHTEDKNGYYQASAKIVF